MAILLVKIEQPESIPLNEFFDYNGQCYAISRDREKRTDSAIRLEDFFEASIRSQELLHITVVFTILEEGAYKIVGWYKEATIYRDVKRPSLFLEGNIVAASSEVVLLPEKERTNVVSWQGREKNYEIVELEDRRADYLYGLISSYEGENAFLRYPYVVTKLTPAATKSVAACTDACKFYAGNILDNTCRDLSEIKLLEAYAKRLTELDSHLADGFYYLAMAQYQLGFPKKAIKAIEKALKLEPEAADLIAQKGMICWSMGYEEAAHECFDKAYELSQDEDYLLLKDVGKKSFLSELGRVFRGMR